MQVIMITRLYAMYQQSRKMLVFLVVILLAVTICCAALAVKLSGIASGGKL